MGFKYWYEGLILVFFFFLIIGIPCSFVAIHGSKMINDIGNFPTKTAKIQTRGWYWVIIIEIVSFVLMAVFLRVFSS